MLMLYTLLQCQSADWWDGNNCALWENVCCKFLYCVQVVQGIASHAHY